MQLLKYIITHHHSYVATCLHLSFYTICEYIIENYTVYWYTSTNCTFYYSYFTHTKCWNLPIRGIMYLYTSHNSRTFLLGKSYFQYNIQQKKIEGKKGGDVKS
jgi:hypothetical protein